MMYDACYVLRNFLLFLLYVKYLFLCRVALRQIQIKSVSVAKVSIALCTFVQLRKLLDVVVRYRMLCLLLTQTERRIGEGRGTAA